MSKEKLTKSLPEYLPEFIKEFTTQIVYDNDRWGDTWKERGLFWNDKTQEERFFEWLAKQWDQHRNYGVPIPWLKVAGEAFIGYIREKYLSVGK